MPLHPCRCRGPWWGHVQAIALLVEELADRLELAATGVRAARRGLVRDGDERVVVVVDHVEDRAGRANEVVRVRTARDLRVFAGIHVACRIGELRLHGDRAEVGAVRAIHDGEVLVVAAHDAQRVHAAG